MPSHMCRREEPTDSPDEDLSTSSFGFLDITQNLVISEFVARDSLTEMYLRHDREQTHMTGPIKLSSLVGLPTLIPATCSRSLSLKPPAFHTEEETYNLERAEHFWPMRM